MVAGMLAQSAERHVPIEIIYMSEKGSITQRKIQVLSIEGEKVWAFCSLRQMKRSFKIGNILSARPVRKNWQRSG